MYIHVLIALLYSMYCINRYSDTDNQDGLVLDYQDIELSKKELILGHNYMNHHAD